MAIKLHIEGMGSATHLFSVAVLLLAVGLPTSAQAQKCRMVGGTFFCDGGQTLQREQPDTRVSPNRLRGDRFSPDATNATRRGAQLYVQPRGVARPNRADRIDLPGQPEPIRRPRGLNRIGPKSLNGDGSSCTTVGNRMTCY